MFEVLKVGFLEMLARLSLVEQRVADEASVDCLRQSAEPVRQACVDTLTDSEHQFPADGVQGGADQADDPESPGMSMAGTGLRAELF